MKVFLISLFWSLSLTVFADAQNSQLKILDQPKPALPADYGTLDAQGSISLKVEFLASGAIGKITPINKMPVSNLTELAIAAANKIKFQAEVKNGIAVDIDGTVKYLYSYDGGWSIPPKISENLQTVSDPQAEAVIQKAIKNLGGDKYLNVQSQIGRGKFSVIRDGAVISFQTFIDVIVFPDKERTDFKGGGVRSSQTNAGGTGWVYDGDQDLIKVQTPEQLENFRRGMRISLDNLLRGHWRKDAKLAYIGKRPATLGKRNDAVKLTYADGLVVEFEFAVDDGLPVKAMYKRQNADGEEVKEEDRYAQFLDFGGIRSPFIIDRFSNGVQNSRLNYESLEFNKKIPESIFVKPANAKEMKKDLKL